MKTIGIKKEIVVNGKKVVYTETIPACFESGDTDVFGRSLTTSLSDAIHKVTDKDYKAIRIGVITAHCFACGKAHKMELWVDNGEVVEYKSKDGMPNYETAGRFTMYCKKHNYHNKVDIDCEEYENDTNVRFLYWQNVSEAIHKRKEIGYQLEMDDVEEMIKNGDSDEDIVVMTGLFPEEVENLRKKVVNNEKD